MQNNPVFVGVALLSGSLVLALILAELLLRFLGIGYGNAPLNPHPVFHHVHPPDYRYLSYVPSGEYGGHTVYFDKDGLTEDPNSDSPPEREAPAKYRVAFMGDSFVEAAQVPFSESFVGLLRTMAKDHTVLKNYGTTSFSPLLHLVQFKKMVLPFRPTHVFLLLYSNDPRDDKTLLPNAVFDEKGELQAVPDKRSYFFVRLLRHFYLARLFSRAQVQLEWLSRQRGKPRLAVAGGFLEEAPDIAPPTSRFLSSLVTQIEKSGALLLLSAVPSKARLHNPNTAAGEEFSDKVGNWAEQHGVPFLDLVPAFKAATASGERLFFKRDIHFNSAGHRVLATEFRRAFPELFKNPSKQIK